MGHSHWKITEITAPGVNGLSYSIASDEVDIPVRYAVDRVTETFGVVTHMVIDSVPAGDLLSSSSWTRESDGLPDSDKPVILLTKTLHNDKWDITVVRWNNMTRAWYRGPLITGEGYWRYVETIGLPPGISV